MNPASHFAAYLDRLTASLPGGGSTGPAASILDQAEQEFAALIAPIIGVSPAKHLAFYAREHTQHDAPGFLQKMGYMAAFFLGEYNDASMPLEVEDWQEIRETIEDASEEIDITVLTSLMNELLSRRLLERR
ncbi:MAG: hypothetical protein LBP81_04855 [Treponema sp.]|jgi:hypothetical protein|nr:hypothetical protein [Treponema sp.]